MARIPTVHVDPTVVAMKKAYGRHRNEVAAKDMRSYLGMSAIGMVCGRSLYYGFRWCAPFRQDPDTWAKIDDGHTGEPLLADRLRLVPGITLDTNNADGGQYRVTDFGGHFAGHCDGAIWGLQQAPDEVHIWECKVTERIGELLRHVDKLGELNALKAWDNTYYVQAQMYMHYFGLDWHYLNAASPGLRDYTGIRTQRDDRTIEHYRQRARAIILAVEPPPRISEKADHFECADCTHAAHCHGEIAPLANCRTCVSSTPNLDTGEWICERFGHVLTLDEQIKGCESHLYIPSLLSYAEPVDSSDHGVLYKMCDGDGEFMNSVDGLGIASRELQHIPANMIGNSMVDGLRAEGARFVGAEKVEA